MPRDAKLAGYADPIAMQGFRQFGADEKLKMDEGFSTSVVPGKSPKASPFRVEASMLENQSKGVSTSC